MLLMAGFFCLKVGVPLFDLFSSNIFSILSARKVIAKSI